LIFWAAGAALAATPEQIEFFEKNVRPVLAAHCYACHSSKAKSSFANLRLDSGAGLARGSDAGPVVVPGKPAESRLIRAVRGELPQPMPPGGRLPAAAIAALEKWVEMGAVWPGEAAPAASPSGGFDLEARRRAHWAWQPVRAVAPPAVRDVKWPLNEIDRFVLAGLEKRSLRPAGEAARAAWLRRVTFDLTGLPPMPGELDRFERDTAAGAHERVVDRLLQSESFGERFARRWMDLIRYSESHGSEGDPDTPHAWRYRDYLVRAFNGDVPYGQLIREHLAGDLLARPRLNARDGLNESLLGTAHLRMVEHGFQPVDPWEDRVKWTENQVDVLSKAFQGVTVACARCHDHKFDAISQKDFYALLGTIAGARPVQAAVDAPERLELHQARLSELKGKIRAELARAWRVEAAALPGRVADGAVDPLRLEDVPCDESSPLYPLVAKAEVGAWQRRQRAALEERRAFNRENFEVRWDTRRDFARFYRMGVGAPAEAKGAGEFRVAKEGAAAIGGVLGGGTYSGLISAKNAAVFQTPRFKIETDSISFRMSGGGFSNAVLIVENYAVPRGGIYNLRFAPQTDGLGWHRWDATFWKGFTAYIEFAGFEDLTHFTRTDGGGTPLPTDGRSWFGVREIAFHNNRLTPKDDLHPAEDVLGCDAGRYAACVGERLTAAAAAFGAGAMTEPQASLLDYFVRRGLLSNAADELVAEYRRLEAEIPAPRRAPSVLEEAPPDHPLLVRGNHNQRGEPVPKGFLTALGGRRFGDAAQARLALAEEVARRDNPLTARVMVNRIWQHLFRRGLAATVDNLGKLGEAPSNPELLDYLAEQFSRDGSIKGAIRRLAVSRAYRMAALPLPANREADPDNRLVHHVPMRRLEAEEIRDAILSVAGTLDGTMYGPSVAVHYAHDTGQTKGDRPKGPLDGKGRRSLYLEIRRNATNPFLEAFDVYKPASARGQRDVTNVPGQSLALMNSPFVVEQAARGAGQFENSRAGVEALYRRALGRAPTAVEVDRARSFVAETGAEEAAGGMARLMQAVFNFKEFLYVQ